MVKKSTIVMVGISLAALCSIGVYLYWNSDALPVSGHAITSPSSGDIEVDVDAARRPDAVETGEIGQTLTATVEQIVETRDGVGATLEQLKRIAESGNGDASYQLYKDLQHCAFIDLRAKSIEQLAMRREDSGDALGQAVDTIEQDLAFCEGVTSDQSSGYYDWLKRAARDGQTQAMSEFFNVLAEFNDPRVSLDRAEEVVQLKREATDHLIEAASRGHIDAIGRLADFYEHGGVVSRDLVEAYAYTSLMSELRAGSGWADNLERISSQLSAAQLDQARRRAEQLASACCGRT
jgi:hypothetical protein